CAYTRLLGKVRTQPPYLPGTLFSYPSFLDPLRASTCFCVGVSSLHLQHVLDVFPPGSKDLDFFIKSFELSTSLLIC
ncbi:hypothetical protein TNCT_420771, partial [Trichonephila clavata]